MIAKLICRLFGHQFINMYRSKRCFRCGLEIKKKNLTLINGSRLIVESKELLP
jgi:hypothetical protein